MNGFKMRQRIERDIIGKVVDVLLRNGFSISINNGGDEDELSRSTNREEIMAHIMLADSDRIYAMKGGLMMGAVLAVYGNDGWDVICDYSTKLEPFIGEGTEVMAAIDRWEKEA